MDPLEVILASSNVVLVGGLTILGYWARGKWNRVRELERQLREERIKVYEELLHPYVVLFTRMDDEEKTKEVFSTLLSVDYRKTSFRLVLLAEDEVVQAYNRLMQFTFKVGREGHTDPIEMMGLFAKLLREIRRSFGNDKTSLAHWEMIRFMIKDLDEELAKRGISLPK